MNHDIPTELFELRVITDDPRYEGFALPHAPSVLGRDSLDEDIAPGFGDSESNSNWKQQQLRDKWAPPTVVGRVAPYNDYPGLDMMLPAFSERAVCELAPFLEPNGELLQLRTDGASNYFFFNITTVLDALDHDRSQCHFWCDPPTTTDSIDYFAFHEEKLRGQSIFRLREWPIGVLVSDQFVRRTIEAGLNGFNFVKLWPLAPGEDWRVVSKARRKITPIGGLKSHTLVLMLPLRDRKPDAAETQLIKQLEVDLDAQLATRTLDAPYFGSYEGHDIVDSTYRMFLSTPDVNRLEIELQPWFAQLKWHAPIKSVKRFGQLHETDVIEEVRVLG